MEKPRKTNPDSISSFTKGTLLDSTNKPRRIKWNPTLSLQHPSSKMNPPVCDQLAKPTRCHRLGTTYRTSLAGKIRNSPLQGYSLTCHLFLYWRHHQSQDPILLPTGQRINYSNRPMTATIN